MGVFIVIKLKELIAGGMIQFAYLFCHTMALLEETSQKLTKDELVNLYSDYQSKLNSMAKIDEDMGKLRKDFEKREPHLTAIYRSGNSKLKVGIISLEHQCWSNSQYARRQCLEITGLHDNINNEDLEEKAPMILEKLEVIVDSSNVEDFHWLSSNGKKKFIIKLSRNARMLIIFDW